jgi:hypothetical protein
MKIEFTPKRVKLARVAIALVAISLAGYVAYAASQLSISNTGTVVLANKNWQGITFNPGAVGFPTSAAGCPTTGYSDTPSPIAFSNIAQGTASTGAVCVKNVSTGGQSYTASTAASPTLPTGTTVTYSADGGTATSGSIASNGISLLTITVTAGQTTGSVTFTTTIV